MDDTMPPIFHQSDIKEAKAAGAGIPNLSSSSVLVTNILGLGDL